MASHLELVLAVAVKEGLQYFEFGLPDGPLVLTTEAAITGLIIGITVTIFSSLLPARKASQVSPMEAIRDSVSTPQRKSLLVRLLIWFANFCSWIWSVVWSFV